MKINFHSYFELFNSNDDQDRISPHNINTISSKQVMRIKKNFNKAIISWSNNKFSELTLQELIGRKQGELLVRSWEWKDWNRTNLLLYGFTRYWFWSLLELWKHGIKPYHIVCFKQVSYFFKKHFNFQRTEILLWTL